MDYRCETHLLEYKDNYTVSPCRRVCRLCKKQKVHGSEKKHRN